ncbi:hypothetical protein PT273_05600 [Orbaceae bacterium ESL0727]|nr:hypothetical protein [Orbaceae bacterium ESL0727]
MDTQLTNNMARINSLLKRPLLSHWLYNIVFGCIVFSTNVSASLIAVTSNKIQGQAPYFTLNQGQTKLTTLDEFLTIKLSNGVEYSIANNPSQINHPIELPVIGQSMADVTMQIPATLDNVAFNTFVSDPYNYWKDDNGDGNATATGTLSVTITDVNGNAVNRSTTLDGCNAPYKVKLASTNVTLRTLYGYTNSTNYAAVSAIYYIKPKVDTPSACFAQPNLQSHGQNYDGPASMWNATKGFILQSLSDPSKNFPTMGANNLFFNLTVSGVFGSDVTYSKTPSNSGIDLIIEPITNKNVAKITLTGPSKSATDAVAATAVPTTFTLYSDRDRSNAIYRFTISKWFIGQGDDKMTHTQLASRCSAIHYRIPDVTEYTNANSGASYGNWQGGLAGQPNNYQRRIGGGLFAEWGNTSTPYYTGSDYSSGANWAANEGDNSSSRTLYYIVSSNIGFINIYDQTMTIFGSCVTP